MKTWMILLGIGSAGLYLYSKRNRPPGRDGGRDGLLYWDAITARPRTAPEVGAMVTAFLDGVPDPPKIEEKRVLSFFLTIERAGMSFRVEPALIAAIVSRESGGNPNAIGAVGEVGLMQVRPTTADFVNGLGIYRGDRQSLSDPAININYGAGYLRWQFDQYAGRTNRVRWAVSGYNAGTPRFDQGSGRFANEVYVADVVDFRLPRYAYLFNQIYRRYGRP